MDELIKTCKFYLYGAITISILFLLAAGFFHYLDQPSIYITQPNTTQSSLEHTISQATDIESLKSVCSVFAKCYDEHSNYIFNFTDHLNKLLIGIAILFFLMVNIFCSGYYKILKLAKSIKHENNAL